MNTILDVLYLRMPRIEYVCPPICETIFSGSGSAVIVLEPIAGLTFPTGLILEGRGRSYLTWSSYPGQLCYTVYFQPNSGDPFSAISECVPPNTIALCKAGFYKISATLGDGTTTDLSQIFIVTGSGYGYMPTPQVPNPVCFNLFYSETLNGTYEPEFLCIPAGNNIFQTCSPGCYRTSAITLDGETPLSPPECYGPCTPTACAPGFGWSDLLCSCVPCTDDVPCPEGFAWDVTQCKCIAAGPPGPPFQFNFCKDVTDGFTFMAPEGFAAPCTFSLVGSLPPGVTFTQDSPLSASIHGTATDYGTFNFVVEITDAGNQFQELSYRLFVEGINSENPPPTPLLGVPYSFTWTATGGVPPYVWEIQYLAPHLGGIPGLTFDPATATLSGTPTTPGTYSFQVNETDSLNYTSCFSCEPTENCSFKIGLCPNWDTLTPWFTLSSGADGGGSFAFSQTTPNNQFVQVNVPNGLTGDAQIERQGATVMCPGNACSANLHVVTHKVGNPALLCGGVNIFNPGPGGPVFSFFWDASAHPAGTYDVPFNLPANGGVPYNIVVDVGAIAGSACGTPSAGVLALEIEATITNL